MASTKKKAGTTATRGTKARKTAVRKTDGFINVAVSNSTRHGLHLLKEAMGLPGQAEVIERLVAIGLAIHLASR